MQKRKSQDQEQLVGFLGVGLDNDDGHKRVTKSENFVLLGGSEETHGQMQDTAIYFNEKLEQRGKRLQDTSPQEALDLLRDAIEKSE